MLVVKKDEKSLAFECKEIVDTKINPGAESQVRGYWEIGSHFITYEAEGWIERVRGDAAVKKVAGEIGLHYVNLYAAIAFAERFPTEAEVSQFLIERKNNNALLSWSAIKSQVLPRFAKVKEKDQEHELLSQAERLAEQLEGITGEIKNRAATASPEDREVYENVREKLTETVKEAKDALAHPKKRREVSQDYLEWIKRQPEWLCIVSSRPHADPHHLRTRGAGGSDFDVVPLDREFHQKVEEPGFWNTKTVLALFYWGYQKKEIDERYLRQSI